MRVDARTTGMVVLLSRMRRGQVGTVQRAELTGSDERYLAAMGLTGAARIRICRTGEPCIVAIGGSASGVQDAAGMTAPRCGCGWGARIGLARALAERIWVLLDS